MTSKALTRKRSSAVVSKAARWTVRITRCWRQSVEGFFRTGSMLIQAKVALDHGQFQAMIESKLPFGARTAQMLMAVAADKRLSNAKRISHLPPNWGALYDLTRLDDRTLEKHFKNGTICPEMERSDISTTVKQQNRERREAELGTLQRALPDKKYGVILADPEWRFEPWSRSTGMDRAPDNHYPTSCTEVIASRDVNSIAADDCTLFLWATIPMLPHALAVMEAWGFDYKSHYAWGKPKGGTGYWSRERHELLLIGTRGTVPCPAQGEQYESLIEAPRGKRHSQKPEIFLTMIEKYFPNVPKIELNRRGKPRPGWDAWGLEAEQQDAA